jgi:hypothetical protein
VIDRKLSVAASNCSEQIDPERMRKQERRPVLPQKVSRFVGEPAIWDADSGDDVSHDQLPRAQED